MAFQAILCRQHDGEHKCELTSMEEADLMDGDVLIDVAFSTLNYKDGLALTATAPIIRHYPMIGGIDLSGVVARSANSDFAQGQKVIINGYGLSENHFGGYAQKAQVKSKWLIALPDKISLKQAMAIGTAGYTASLCLLALKDHNITPDKGKILVTGAAGGVGSIAIMLLAQAGYDIIASTGRMGEKDYLTSLGAKEIISRDELSQPKSPIAKPRWAGAIDCVGSHTLANVLAATDYRGCVAACGLAQGMDLPTSVAPFILRNITLAGIDSVMAPREVRQRAWDYLANHLDLNQLEKATQTAPLADTPFMAQQILKGQIRGRVVIDVNR